MYFTKSMMWWPFPRYSIWMLLMFFFTNSVTTFSLPGCNSYGNFDIVQNQQPSLTCTGLAARHNIYWSIFDPSSNKETRIAECARCYPNCPPCSNLNAGYNVSRESNETTLQFLNSSLVTEKSTIKCSAFLNHTNATCRLFVVPAYTISECRENALKVKDGMQTPIRCEGLLTAQNMYWTITYGNGTVSTVAECNACRNSPAACPDCYVPHTDFNVTREENSSTLVIQNNIGQKDGATLRCSKKDNLTHDDCKLRVESHGFNLPECNNEGNFDIVQNEQPSLTCTGLRAEHNIYWSISDTSSNKETRIGDCGNCGESCPPCSSLVEGYNVSRQEDSTTLQFLNPALITDESRVICSSVNYSIKTTCALFVVPALKSSTAFPVAAVAGGVAGVVLVVVVIVVSVVVAKRMRAKGKESTSREDIASSTNGATETYDDLHLPDVGQQSVYSEIEPRPVSTSSGADYIDLYNGLDMSEVGQRSEYSQLGQNI